MSSEGGFRLKGISSTKIVSLDVSAIRNMVANDFNYMPPFEDVTSYYSFDTDYGLRSPFFVLSNNNLLMSMNFYPFWFLYDNKLKNFTIMVNDAVLTSRPACHLKQAIESNTLWAKCNTGDSVEFWKFDLFFQRFVKLRVVTYPANITITNGYIGNNNWVPTSKYIYYAASRGFNVWGPETQFLNRWTISYYPVVGPYTMDEQLVGTRLLSRVDNRDYVDHASLADSMTSMTFDRTIQKIMIVMNSDMVYQVFGKRNYFANDLSYRYQEISPVVHFDETTRTYVPAYNGIGISPSTTFSYAYGISWTCVSQYLSAYRTWAGNLALYNQQQRKFMADPL
ncbi:hypothetical protein FDP41_002436 [Naegleria fowleri]|uniref:Uncharacterized protein n=1 Tax=Naegleria fowleri TaxID=5763 RepID=A0A6A5BTS6_NAEFO|nr:uncharacterized protein FDP41_002436 [Naegleria fowleri]KAF0978616.1 hypothetical protein FDP41_002436 [Naegleria fowleri]CAG4710447.1 unnamed protein product [Naegleria fowleri]